MLSANIYYSINMYIRYVISNKMSLFNYGKLPDNLLYISIYFHPHTRVFYPENAVR